MNFASAEQQMALDDMKREKKQKKEQHLNDTSRIVEQNDEIIKLLTEMLEQSRPKSRPNTGPR